MADEKVRKTFQQAIRILACEKGRIKDRLLVAYASQLSDIRPQEDLPELIVDEFKLLRYSLSDEGMPYGYAEHAAKKLDEMDEDEAVEVAEKMFTIYVRLMGIDRVAKI